MAAQSPSILMSDVKQEEKVHPWRRCPKAMHFVKEHQSHIEPSKTHPDGIFIVHAHCALNPSGKEELSHDEIQYITKTYFPDLTGSPTAGALPFAEADTYDEEIRGWTRYWNDIFEPKIALDPNMVKALIATESGFRVNPLENKKACGLMQILKSTHTYLQGSRNELKNHLVCSSSDELLEPSTNICSGVRWLFRKARLTSEKLVRDANWVEVIADYKGILSEYIAGKDLKPIIDLESYYGKLRSKNE